MDSSSHVNPALSHRSMPERWRSRRLPAPRHVDGSAELLKHLELDNAGERAARCHHLQRSGRRSSGDYGRDLRIRHHGHRGRRRSVDGDAGASRQTRTENICGFPNLAIRSKRSDKRAQTGRQFEDCAQAVGPRAVATGFTKAYQTKSLPMVPASRKAWWACAYGV
jgi:hypothetical protein